MLRWAGFQDVWGKTVALGGLALGRLGVPTFLGLVWLSPQEVKTLPRGREHTTHSWYVGERLGVSTFGCVTWSRSSGTKWIFLLSRCIDKCSAYARACMERVHELVGQSMAGHHTITEWSDGPKQFKSTMSLGAGQGCSFSLVVIGVWILDSVFLEFGFFSLEF